jgi:MFS family permease
MSKKQKNFNLALKILLATNALVLMAGAMLGPIYALFVSQVGGSLMDAGIAGGIFALAAGLTTLVSGKFSDEVKENELIIVAGYLIMALGYLLYFWVSSIWFLFAVQFIIGIGEAIYVPAFDAVYSTHLDRGKEGTQWGGWESMSYFTAAAGAFIGGALATWFGFKILFLIMAVLTLFSAVYIWHLDRKAL